MKRFVERFRKDRPVWGWVMYDWANSAFVTTVVAGFFPIFFKEYWSAETDANLSTYYLAITNSVGSILVAAMAPVLGAIADQGKNRKSFLMFFAYLGAILSMGLFFIPEGSWRLAALVYMIAVIGFSGANVFYDALLPSVAENDRLDLVSGYGFAAGYLGGGILFLINVLMTLYPESFFLADVNEAVRYSFMSVGIWWCVFMQFTVAWVHEKKDKRKAGKLAVFAGFQQLAATWAHITKLKQTFIFLIAYFLYIDGVDTIIRMAVDYGLSLGFQSTDLIAALLLVQFVGFPAAIAYSYLGKRWDVRKSLFLGIAAYMVVTFGGMMMTEPMHFYILAVMIGLVQGGIQALSRSYYARLIPTRYSGEFFGFYNLIGKSATIIGPILMGGVGLLASRIFGLTTDMSSRLSIGSVLILFVLGAFVLRKVDEATGQREAENFE